MSEKRMNEHESDGRMSREQKVSLIEYMDDHPELVRGKVLGYGRFMNEGLWEILAEQLNSLGPRKSAMKWKRAWLDMKTKTKKKAAKCRNLRNKSGLSRMPLTELDEKIIKIISKNIVPCMQPVEEVFVKSEPTTSEEQLKHATDKSNVVKPSTTTTPVPHKDHDYCTSDFMTDEGDSDFSSESTSSSRVLSPVPGSISRKRRRSTLKKEETINYLKESGQKYDQRIDTVLSLLKDNNETLKETNQLLRELISVIKKK